MEKNYLDLLNEIRELHAKYKESIEGRKDIINAIREKSREIRKHTSACNPELDELERFYSYKDYYISDYKLVMNLILRLANSKEELYSMKEIKTTDFFQMGKDIKQLYSEIIFITDNQAMEEFGDNLYFYDEFSHHATELINQGHSFIIITKNLFEGRVKPKKDNIKCDEVFDIRNSGLIGNITCYINDLGLKEATDKLMEYININGPDFSNTDEDTLFNLMNGIRNNQKKLV